MRIAANKAHIQENAEIAAAYANDMRWTDLKILKTCVKIKISCPIKDSSIKLSFDMDPTEFFRILSEIHERELLKWHRVRLYQGQSCES